MYLIKLTKNLLFCLQQILKILFFFFFANLINKLVSWSFSGTNPKKYKVKINGPNYLT